MAGAGARDCGAPCSILGAGSTRGGAGIGRGVTSGRVAVAGGGTIGLRTGATSTAPGGAGGGGVTGAGAGWGRVTNSGRRVGGIAVAGAGVPGAVSILRPAAPGAG